MFWGKGGGNKMDGFYIRCMLMYMKCDKNFY